MFPAWGRKQVPGGGGTGKEKEEERKRVPSYSCAGSFLFLSYVLPASQRGPYFLCLLINFLRIFLNHAHLIHLTMYEQLVANITICI